MIPATLRFRLESFPVSAGTPGIWWKGFRRNILSSELSLRWNTVIEERVPGCIRLSLTVKFKVNVFTPVHFPWSPTSTLTHKSNREKLMEVFTHCNELQVVLVPLVRMNHLMMQVEQSSLSCDSWRGKLQWKNSKKPTSEYHLCICLFYFCGTTEELRIILSSLQVPCRFPFSRSTHPVRRSPDDAELW